MAVREDSNYDVNANTVAYYKLNETSGTSVADSSGNSNTGTATDVSWTGGKFGNCASFNGSSIIKTGNNTLVSWNTVTHFAWIKSTWNNIYITNRDWFSSWWAFFMGIWTNNANKLNIYLFWVTDAWWKTSSVSVNDGNWNLVWFTFDWSDLRIYINGTLDAIYSQSWNITSTSRPFYIWWRIGNDLWTVITGWFNWLIDEVIIENRVWTAQQVLDYYNKSQERFLWEYLWAGTATTKWLYHLNGNSNDASGNGNNWTDTNISYVAGKFWQCASFNGTSSFISNVYSLRWTTTFTVSAWINTASTNAYRWIYTLYYQTSWSQECWNFRQNNAWKIELTDMVTWDEASNTTLAANTWYYITYTRNWTAHKFYVNGVLDKEFTRTVWVSAVTSTEWTTARIWRWVQSSAQFWSGLIDEVIIENRAWTPVEIQKYYTYAKWRFWI